MAGKVLIGYPPIAFEAKRVFFVVHGHFPVGPNQASEMDLLVLALCAPEEGAKVNLKRVAVNAAAHQGIVGIGCFGHGGDRHG